MISFSILKIDFQDCKDCGCDYVQIYDGPTNQGKSSGRYIDGVRIPPSFFPAAKTCILPCEQIRSGPRKALKQLS